MGRRQFGETRSGALGEELGRAPKASLSGVEKRVEILEFWFPTWELIFFSTLDKSLNSPDLFVSTEK